MKILVIAGSGIGNILLATPIMRSLRRAYPEAKIDALVPVGRGEIIEGNPDINEVVEVCRKDGLYARMQFIHRMWRHYDLALSARAGDRSILNAWMGGRKRLSHVKRCSSPRTWQKLLLHDWVPADRETHVVLHGLQLLDTLGIRKCYDVVPPECPVSHREALDQLLPFSRQRQSFAVAHLFPRNRYKCWTDEGWHRVFRQLTSYGLPVVVTGGGGRQETQYVNTVLAAGDGQEVINLNGKLTLRQVSDLLSRCSIYAGPDTGVTHLAAAHGIPTVALYGPTDPVYWAPWPSGYAGTTPPFVRRGCQTVNNVWLVQGDAECSGCGKEGCDDDPHHPSRCMEELRAETVTEVIDGIMRERSGGIQPQWKDRKETRI